MPSRFEGWGLAAVEASAAGKAVVATRIPGLADAVRDGETGILVEPESASALASGLRRLLEDPRERRRLGRSGRRWAERFTWDRVSAAQEEIYHLVTRTEPGSGSPCHG